MPILEALIGPLAAIIDKVIPDREARDRDGVCHRVIIGVWAYQRKTEQDANKREGQCKRLGRLQIA